jgi:hypothetical protein
MATIIVGIYASRDGGRLARRLAERQLDYLLDGGGRQARDAGLKASVA